MPPNRFSLIMTAVCFNNISKKFGITIAADEISLDIAAGEFCSLVGPSGCGKTTLLRIAAGFIQPDSGQILLNGKPVNDLPPNRRDVGFVFQNYALFPTKTVGQNIGFSLTLRRVAKDEVTRRVYELCDMMHLDGLVDRYPHELSGGQQQRVALARSLISRPSILLLDEPLSALDAKIRTQLRTEIRRIIEKFGITAVYVTHDQEEALSISDRVAIMNKGKLLQVGSPMDIYLHPCDDFVAHFVGTTNSLPCAVRNNGQVMVGTTVLTAGGNSNEVPVGPATLTLRPEHVDLLPHGNGGIAAVLREISFLGPTVRLSLVTLDNYTILADVPTTEWLDRPLDLGASVSWTVPKGLPCIFPLSPKSENFSG